MTKKLTAEQILAQKIAKRDQYKEKWERGLAYAEAQLSYAKASEKEYRKRQIQAEAMVTRIEAGKKARAEADAVREAHLKNLADPEYMKSEEAAKMNEYIQSRDRFYHATTTEVARINNGFVDDELMKEQ